MICCSSLSMQAIKFMNTGPNMAQGFGGEYKWPLSELFPQVLLLEGEIFHITNYQVGTIPEWFRAAKTFIKKVLRILNILFHVALYQHLSNACLYLIKIISL